MATNNAINTNKPIEVASGGTGATTYTTDGVLYYSGSVVASTAVGTATDTLRSNGAGVAPSYYTQSSGTTGVETFVTGTGTATQASRIINILGTANQVSTSASASTITITIPSSPSFGGTTTVASGATITAGDLAVSNGLVTLPIWGASKGRVTINSLVALAMINDGGSVTRNIQMGNAGNNSMVVADNVFIGNTCAAAATSPPQWDVCIGSAVIPAGANFSKNNLIGYKVANAAGNNDSVTALGYQAIKNAVGAALLDVSIGADSSSAYVNGANERSNIIISNAGVAAEAHVMRLGTTGTGSNQVSSTFMAAVYGTTIGGTGIPVVVDSADQLGTVASSIRFKTDIQTMGDNDWLYKLRPVSFRYKKDPNYLCYGLIAEEVYEVAPHMVAFTSTGQIHTVKYMELTSLILNELQKQKKRIQILQERIQALGGNDVQ